MGIADMNAIRCLGTFFWHGSFHHFARNNFNLIPLNSKCGGTETLGPVESDKEYEDALLCGAGIAPQTADTLVRIILLLFKAHQCTRLSYKIRKRIKSSVTVICANNIVKFDWCDVVGVKVNFPLLAEVVANVRMYVWSSFLHSSPQVLII